MREDALTVDTVQPGDEILCWEVVGVGRARRFTILDAPYPDSGGNLVVDVRHSDGSDATKFTSEIGLSGDRYDGRWSAIATRIRRTEG